MPRTWRFISGNYLRSAVLAGSSREPLIAKRQFAYSARASVSLAVDSTSCKRAPKVSRGSISTTFQSSRPSSTHAPGSSQLAGVIPVPLSMTPLFVTPPSCDLARIIHDLVSSDDPLFRATGAPGPRAKSSSRDRRLRWSLLPQTFGLWSSGISRRQRYSCITNVSFVHPEDEIVTPDRSTAKGEALHCSSRNDLMNKPG